MKKIIPDVSFEKVALPLSLIGGTIGAAGGAMTSKEHPVRNAAIGAGIGAGAGLMLRGASNLATAATAKNTVAPKALLNVSKAPPETWGAAKKVPVMDALGKQRGSATMAEKLSMLKNYVHRYRNVL